MQSGGGGVIIYQVNPSLSMQGGLAVRVVNDWFSNSSESAQNFASTRNANGGSLNIAIPIRLNLTLGTGI